MQGVSCRLWLLVHQCNVQLFCLRTPCCLRDCIMPETFPGEYSIHIVWNCCLVLPWLGGTARMSGGCPNYACIRLRSRLLGDTESGATQSRPLNANMHSISQSQLRYSINHRPAPRCMSRRTGAGSTVLAVWRNNGARKHAYVSQGTGLATIWQTAP